METNNNNVVYQPIKAAAKVTGLSEYFLRRNIKAGNVPHIMSGNKALVDVPLLLEGLRNKAGVADGEK